MAVKELDSKEFDGFVKVGKSIVDFSAEWCAPCKILKPIFEDASSTIKDVNFGSVDVDKHSELAQKFQVMSVPIMIFLKDGVVVDKVTGVLSKEELAKKASEF
jgi:thioredoxin 1